MIERLQNSPTDEFREPTALFAVSGSDPIDPIGHSPANSRHDSE